MYKCKNCGENFFTYNIGQLTCSRKCYGKIKSAKSLQQKTCQTCKKSFFIKKGKVKEGRGKYCSKNCFFSRKPKYCENELLNMWNKGWSIHKISTKVAVSEETIRRWAHKINIYQPRHATGQQCHNWKGGVKTYRRKAFQKYEKKCLRCGYKEFPQIIEIHHSDGDRKNNSIHNLIPLCPTCHKALHRKLITLNNSKGPEGPQC